MRRLAACLLLGVSACAVGPEYRRPPLAQPERVTTAPLAARSAASKVPGGNAQTLQPGGDIAGDWWTLFRSPEITRLVRLAVSDNPSLEQARQTLTNARELVLAQQGTLFPSVSGTFNRLRQEAPLTYQYGYQTPAQNFTGYTAQLGLSYTLDVWGGLRRAVEQAGAQADYQRFELEQSYLALTAGVVTSAIQAASLRAQIAAQRQLIGFEQKQLDTVRRQFELGGATGTDVATQQAQVAQAQTTLVPIETQLAQANDQLAAFLGRAPSQAAIPEIDLDRLTLPETVPVSLPVALLDQRPDVRFQEAYLHEQVALLGVDIARRLPQFTLQAAAGSTAGDIHQLFSPTNGMWSLLTQATQPIFDAGQLLHQQRAQAATVRAAAAQWRDTVVKADQNVADILVALQNDAVALQYALTAETAGRRSLDLASLQYKLGGVSYLSVLTAEQTYQNAVITLVRARAARFADTAGLFQALGGGWWHRDDLPPPPPGLLSSPLP